MKRTLQLEEFAQFMLGILFFSTLNYSWWWFPAVLFAPDIGMLGYLINTKVGAFTYNVFHHKGLAILIGVLGYYYTNDLVLFIGIILFSHAAFDRLLGYGLKYSDHFKHTHLGTIGKK